MTKPKNTEFKTLMSYIKKLQSRYFHALSAFYAYEGMKEAAAPNVVGPSRAKANVKTMDKYRNFFVPTQEALRTYFFLELGKLLDVSDQSLHINKIVNFTESKLKHLTIDAFTEYNQDRQLLKELTERYKGLQYSDLALIRKMLEKQNKAIKKAKTYRDKWLVHDDVRKPKLPSISAAEVKELFKTIEKILNTISGKLNDETWMYHHVENNAKHHVALVIDYLSRFEPYRLKEIQKKYKQNYIKK